MLAHLLLAQLTLLLTAAMYAIDRLGRWRPQWLAVPAAAGLVWALAIGPSRAATGLTAGPRHVLGYLGAIDRYPGHLLHLADAFAGSSRWLPQQFPLALILASAETLGLAWLQRRLSGGHPWRPGLIVAARRWLTTAALRSGGVVARDGARVGLDVATGRPAEISWAEAEGGVLCAGAAGTAGATGTAGTAWTAGTDGSPGPAEAGFPLALAAIRRRKPVIVVDLTGSVWLAEALAGACPEPGAPLQAFGPDGPGFYEPLRGGDPARACGLVMSMIDWTGATDQQRRSCAAYLTDALAVQAAAPRDRRAPALEDLVRLLAPEALRERAALIPAYHPRRSVLTDRASVSAGLLQADPATVAAAADQLSALLASAPGRWLRPGPPDAARVSLGQTVRDRGVALFCLDGREGHGPDGRVAAMIGGLVVTDLIAVCRELEDMSVPGDGLAWINGCEILGERALAGLVAQGRAAGMAVVLGTASAAAAGRLAAGVNVLLSPVAEPPARDGFTLRARQPRDRLLPHCRHVQTAVAWRAP